MSIYCLRLQGKKKLSNKHTLPELQYKRSAQDLQTWPLNLKGVDTANQCPRKKKESNIRGRESYHNFRPTERRTKPKIIFKFATNGKNFPNLQELFCCYLFIFSKNKAFDLPQVH